MFPKVFKILLNSSTEVLDLTKQGRLFQMSLPLKCTEFVPYTIDFADGNNREDHFLRNDSQCFLNFEGNSFSLQNIQFKGTFQPAIFNANNRNTKKRCEICSKLTIKILEQRYWGCFGVYIVNFEQILHLLLVFLLLTLSR